MEWSFKYDITREIILKSHYFAIQYVSVAASTQLHLLDYIQNKLEEPFVLYFLEWLYHRVLE